MQFKVTKRVGFLLLAIYLILQGLTVLAPILNGIGPIIGLIGLAAGVLILIDR